jgi:uncharacterized membrane protein YhhN
MAAGGRNAYVMGVSLWLSILVIAISAAFATAGAYRRSRFTHYAFKPLTMILIISLAWERTNGSAHPYGYLILAGLCFGLMGDVFLMLPRNRLRQGILAFAAGHGLYIAAFALGTRTFSMPLLAGLLVYGAAVFLFLSPRLGRLRWPVLAYIVIVCLMAWLAVGRHLILHDEKSLYPFLGGLLFLFSDSVNAVKRFRTPFRLAEVLVLIPYFAAQLLFALSI